MICVIMSTKPVTGTDGSAENAFYPPTSIYYEITFEKLK